MPKVYQKSGRLSAKKKGRPTRAAPNQGSADQDSVFLGYSGFRSHHSIKDPVATKMEL